MPLDRRPEATHHLGEAAAHGELRDHRRRTHQGVSRPAGGGEAIGRCTRIVARRNRPARLGVEQAGAERIERRRRRRVPAGGGEGARGRVGEAHLAGADGIPVGGGEGSPLRGALSLSNAGATGVSAPCRWRAKKASMRALMRSSEATASSEDRGWPKPSASWSAISASG
jgi:hypothetical protein